MRILELDLGKYKSVACDYEAETGRHRFTTIPTNPKALHDLIVDREPDRVVIEICSIAGWVSDLVRALGMEIQIVNPNEMNGVNGTLSTSYASWRSTDT